MAILGGRKAAVTVAAFGDVAQAILSLRSAEHFLPGFDLFWVVLDSPEEMAVPEELARVLPAAQLFGDDFLNHAFFCTKEELRQVSACRAVAHLQKEYDTVALLEPGALLVGQVFGIDFLLGADRVLTFETSPAPVSPPLKTLQQDMYDNGAGLAFYGAGPEMSRYLEWCMDKFDYIERQGITAWADTEHTGKPVDPQTGFYRSWQAFYPLFGMQHQSLQGDVLRPPFKGEDPEHPVLVNFAGIADTMAVPINRPKLANWWENYRKATAKLRMPDVQYRFDRFEDGTLIHPALRGYLRHNYRLRFACRNNPFAHRTLFTDESIVLGDNRRLPVTAIEDALWRLRPDLQNGFPEYKGSQRVVFTGWFLDNAQQEYGLGNRYLEPLRAPYEQALKKAREEEEKAKKARKLTARVSRRLKRLTEGKRKSGAAGVKPEYPQGVNLCAYIRGDFGVAEGGRILADQLAAAGVPFTIIDIANEKLFRHTADRWNHKITNRFTYNTNVMFTNADGLPGFLQDVAPAALKGRYNIGNWAWELPEFPDAWQESFKPLDEVWAVSDFTRDSIAAKSPIPVHTLPHSVQMENSEEAFTRADLGLPEDVFLFLAMYDTRSAAARKNPQGAVKAFLKAFAGDNRAALLIKVNAPDDWDEEDGFLQSLVVYSNVYTIKQTFTRGGTNHLLELSDAYLSLHRSEGFGLGPAEAMYLGKPVVLTNWSGNTQYMRPDNCCPVGYKMVEITEDSGPYKKGGHWAEPDINDAAAQMKRLVDEPAWCKAIAEAGQRTIKEEFSPAATGAILRARLQELGLLAEDTRAEDVEAAAGEDKE